jgi:hypothetical protein
MRGWARQGRQPARVRAPHAARERARALPHGPVRSPLLLPNQAMTSSSSCCALCLLSAPPHSLSTPSCSAVHLPNDRAHPSSKTGLCCADMTTLEPCPTSAMLRNTMPWDVMALGQQRMKNGGLEWSVLCKRAAYVVWLIKNTIGSGTSERLPVPRRYKNGTPTSSSLTRAAVPAAEGPRPETQVPISQIHIIRESEEGSADTPPTSAPASPMWCDPVA